MNIVFIKIVCVGCMVSEIQRVSVFGYCPTDSVRIPLLSPTNKLPKYFGKNDSYIIYGRIIDELIKELYFNEEDITINLKILICHVT